MLTLHPVPLSPRRKIRPALQATAQRGGTLIEVLVSLLITSFGLMALAGLQTTMNSALLESYQRTQAMTLMQDMTQRIEANQSNANNYVTAANTALGTGDAQPATCDTTTLPGATRAQLDHCEWSRLLKGASETRGTSNAGAMLAGRGCIEQVQLPDPSAGVCQPGIYRITVAWQGLNATAAPPASVACAANLYSTEDLRKVVSTQVLIPLPSCS